VRFSQRERDLQQQRQPRLAEALQNLLRGNNQGQGQWPAAQQPARQPQVNQPQANRPQANQSQANQSSRGRAFPSIKPGGLEDGFNQKLPDGVTLQPINNSDIARQIQSGLGGGQAQSPSQSVAAPPPQTAVPPPQNMTAPSLRNAEPLFSPGAASPAPLVKQQDYTMFQNIVQSENNASLLYNYLAQYAPRSQFRSILQDISSNAGKRKNAYNDVCKNMGGAEFEPAKASVPDGVKFYDGVSAAIQEECAMLRSLSEIYELAQDQADSQNIVSQMISKIGDINSLQYVLAQK
jgi:hypothetical protein